MVHSQQDKKCAKKVEKVKKKPDQSSNQPPPDSTPYALTMHSATATLAAHSTLFLVYKWNSELN